jgi:hypothetical protein
MRLPRLTTRRMMVLVAVVAVLIGCALRRHRFLELASRHGEVACPGPKSTPDQVRWIMLRNDYNARMYRKYRLAAWLPFLPVPPDPPPPE